MFVLLEVYRISQAYIVCVWHALMLFCLAYDFNLYWFLTFFWYVPWKYSISNCRLFLTSPHVQMLLSIHCQQTLFIFFLSLMPIYIYIHFTTLSIFRQLGIFGLRLHPPVFPSHVAHRGSGVPPAVLDLSPSLLTFLFIRAWDVKSAVLFILRVSISFYVHPVHQVETPGHVLLHFFSPSI